MKHKNEYALAAFVFSVGSVVLSGWVITVLWKWFVMSYFSLPPLSIPLAIGLSCFVSYITGISGMHMRYILDTQKQGKEEFVKNLLVWYTPPIVSVIFGYIVTLFM